jgi:Fur family ferric uptake transcriptional regulator
MNDVGREEKVVFAAFLTRNRLKRSEQREVILDTFLRSERHLSVDDLLQLVQKRQRDIGRTTVYRTLKLLQEAGLAQELVVQWQTRFERDYKLESEDDAQTILVLRPQLTAEGHPLLVEQRL